MAVALALAVTMAADALDTECDRWLIWPEKAGFERWSTGEDESSAGDAFHELESLSMESAERENEGVHDADRDCLVIPMAEVLVLGVVVGRAERQVVVEKGEDAGCTEVMIPDEGCGCVNDTEEWSVEEEC